MKVGREIMGKKACRRKATTGKKHNMRACKKEATAARKQHTHAEKEDLTKIVVRVFVRFLHKWMKIQIDINIDM
jgi:hypothetical protein